MTLAVVVRAVHDSFASTVAVSGRLVGMLHQGEQFAGVECEQEVVGRNLVQFGVVLWTHCSPGSAQEQY